MNCIHIYYYYYLKHFPNSKQVHSPCLGSVTNPEPRRATKAPNFASTWHLGMRDRMEAINTQVGVGGVGGVVGMGFGSMVVF